MDRRVGFFPPSVGRDTRPIDSSRGGSGYLKFKSLRSLNKSPEACLSVSLLWSVSICPQVVPAHGPYRALLLVDGLRLASCAK